MYGPNTPNATLIAYVMRNLMCTIHRLGAAILLQVMAQNKLLTVLIPSRVLLTAASAFRDQ